MQTFHTIDEEQLGQRSLSRRHVLGKALGFGAAALTVAVVGTGATTTTAQVSTERHTEQPYKTTTNLNLRTGPGTGYKVILVMPAGATVYLMQREENGFYYVSYKGQLGWAHHDYIVEAGQPTDPVEIGTRVARTRLNLRSGPSTSHQILDVVDQGATVTITDKLQNGYRYVIQHTGPAGWVIDSGLGSGSGSGETFTTTARLNLRAQPSTSAKILLVMPSGATVKALAGTASGWRQVSYNGTTGWAATAYLN